MNQEEKQESPSFDFTLHSGTDLPPDTQRCFNGGCFFLQQVYYELGLDRICAMIRTRHGFTYNLNSILSRLLYTRSLFPTSKLSFYKDSKRFIEQPDFDLHQIYRALSVLAAESDYIQARLFKNSMAAGKRRTEVIYYDCTNFYFEIEQAEDDKQYGVSKEKFDMSQFIVCTDAGLSSNTNRYFNQYDKEDGTRDFITTQSVKKLKGYLKNGPWRRKVGGSLEATAGPHII